ncbi:hypothetical protein SO802_015244 [Lithocarpus litseifolius]|uniref:Uncharacterized protein n=1 Tax=Lithocarpus litseifolius TaxID=425828 RepID=A0AAW2CVI8_9ROSI
MIMVPHDFHRMTSLRCDRAIINLEGESSIQLGIDLLRQRHMKEMVCYFDLETDQKPLPQETPEDCAWMAREFLLSSSSVRAHFDGLSFDEVIWSPLVSIPPVADLALEVASFITFGITQPLEGASLRVLYWAETASCQLGTVGLIGDGLVAPPDLLWSVYAYGLDGFTWERPVGCNPNVMGYPFLEGTRVPSMEEHEELVWLVGNLNLEVTQYSRPTLEEFGAIMGEPELGSIILPTLKEDLFDMAHQLFGVPLTMAKRWCTFDKVECLHGFKYFPQ